MEPKLSIFELPFRIEGKFFYYYEGKVRNYFPRKTTDNWQMNRSQVSLQ